MRDDGATLGSGGLLRVAGLPIRYWLCGANPALFAAVAHLNAWEEQYRERARRLAERIGQQLIPHAALSRDDRRLLLAIRRRLHAGEPIDGRLHEKLLAAQDHLTGVDHGLIADVISAGDEGRALAGSWADASAAVTTEQERLCKLPGEFQDSALRSNYFEAVGVGPSNRLASLGRQWRLFERAWRLVTRATTNSTPREWFSHVALLEIGGESGAEALAVSAAHAVHWTQSVRTRRRALAAPAEDWPQPDSWLALNPLHWDEDGNLVIVVLDHHEKATEVAVKRTDLLKAICAALANGPRTCAQVRQALADLPEGERRALAGFVRYLVELGIVQPVAQTAEAVLDRWAKPGERLAHVAAGEPAHTGWVDVYRNADSALAVDTCMRLQESVLQALRLLQVTSSGMEPSPATTDSRGSWSLTEILRAELRSRGLNDIEQERTDPRAVLSAHTPLMRAVEMLEGRAGESAAIDIGPDLLDDLGVPDFVLKWPVDCLLRLPAPEAEFTAVLADLWPPGRGDSRFAEALGNLHGSVPQVEAYKSFLREVEALTGILFVEFLAPPLTDGAANAVRRPAYTEAWTGDPDARAYLPQDAKPGRYVPLRAISLRRSSGRLGAEVDGQPIWPVYHATRSFSPPWDRLARVLLAAAPFDATVAHGRLDSFALWPQRRAVPRITVGGSLVVAPGRWKLSAGDCWDSSWPAVSKVRAVLRLRDRLSLPRWLELAQQSPNTTVACDLESLQGIRLLERCLSAHPEITALEMLPRPDQLLVADLAHRKDDRLVSELLLRVPCNVTPAALASRVVPEILAAARPGESPRPVSRRPGCRSPPQRKKPHIERSAQEWERSWKHG